MTAPARILIAEDNLLNRRLFREVLQIAGFEVSEAEDGEAAIAAVRAGPPDLVLMDLQLPRCSGLDAVRRLKADPALAGIPVVAVTARAGAADADAALRAGCVGHLPKPVAPAELVATVRRLLGAPLDPEGAPVA